MLRSRLVALTVVAGALLSSAPPAAAVSSPPCLLTVGGTWTIFGSGPQLVDLCLGEDAEVDATGGGWVAGSLTRYADGVVDEIFIVGDGDARRPIGVTATGDFAWLAVEVIEGPAGGAVADGQIKGRSAVRHYDVFASGDVDEATLTFSFGDDDGVTHLPTLRVASCDGGELDVVRGPHATTGTPDDGTITVTVDELAGCYTLVGIREGGNANLLE